MQESDGVKERLPEVAPGSKISATVASGPSDGLLSFYDGLRRRVSTWVARRGGRIGPAAAETLLLAPDVVMLLSRMTLDRRVPAETRSIIGGALLYFVVPFDLMPEAALGAGGFWDDLFLASLVLTQALGDDLWPLAESHWSGSRRVEVVMRDAAQAASALLGGGVRDRLRRMLARRVSSTARYRPPPSDAT